MYGLINQRKNNQALGRILAAAKALLAKLLIKWAKLAKLLIKWAKNHEK